MSTERNVADGPTVVRARPKQSALKQIALTSGGLTPTSRSVSIRALQTTERNVGDGPTVVRARPKQSALKQNAPTSGGLTPTSRSVIIRALRTTERNVADGPTVVRASAKQSALKQIALTSEGLTPASRSEIIHALRTTEQNVGYGPTSRAPPPTQNTHSGNPSLCRHRQREGGETHRSTCINSDAGPLQGLARLDIQKSRTPPLPRNPQRAENGSRSLDLLRYRTLRLITA